MSEPESDSDFEAECESKAESDPDFKAEPESNSDCVYV